MGSTPKTGAVTFKHSRAHLLGAWWTQIWSVPMFVLILSFRPGAPLGDLLGVTIGYVVFVAGLSVHNWQVARSVTLSSETIEGRNFLGWRVLLPWVKVATCHEFMVGRGKRPVRLLHLAAGSGRPHILVWDRIEGFEQLAEQVKTQCAGARDIANFTLCERLRWRAT